MWGGLGTGFAHGLDHNHLDERLNEHRQVR